MSIIGLKQTLENVYDYYHPTQGTITIPKDYYTPGFWTIIAALTKYLKLTPDKFNFIDKGQEEYAAAIGFTKALWDNDNYPYQRYNQGKNYSPLEHLSLPSVIDKANSNISGCLRNLLKGYNDNFTHALCNVVNDLHDNVWSHGNASGFSMAQKWKDRQSKEGYYLEFALSDCGCGFLKEMQRVGKTCNSDKEAIEWCIQEGNSTKKHRLEDEWAQSVPEDIMNNPFRGIEKVKHTDNHHMGLGLAKLMKLIEASHGQLWLASGDTILYVDESGKCSYNLFKKSWHGVAIACRFNTAKMDYLTNKNSEDEKELFSIMKNLEAS